MGGSSSKNQGRTSVAPAGGGGGGGGGGTQAGFEKDWDSYEIGEKEIRSVFDAVFYVYDKDSVGYINSDQFGSLMNAFAKDCRPAVTITENDLSSFMDILDKDKNGIVEQNEFVSVSAVHAFTRVRGQVSATTAKRG